ncbi:hypothetical protein Mal52_04650 [Symmachiella dynata]|uniref:Cytochrome c domain-containing protein n=1 Tax=Symmachiella dynata TaxID=2527995 RepID=A0A517ZHR0_9PLAN|nr:DUF1592 domain-containing protein [Symmachiella dynata]QDU42010.1 hypothetical protein Mal52_04650 [Symmachiella dynata]
MRNDDSLARRGVPTVLCALALSMAWQLPSASAEEKSATALDQDYGKTIQPLLRQYCFDCHSADLAEAEVDLSTIPTMAAARKQVKTWLRIRQMLESGQMPPRDEAQPTEAELKALRSWVRDFLTLEANARAGDPGPIVLRRLNNAEYNYTIRDLTGVATLDPTEEFPIDGAAGEGFINTGSAQAMSPSLVTKYLEAAKDVAAHVVLLPDGIRFSPHTSKRDHTDELLARIQSFYRRFTQSGDGTVLTWQGTKFDTDQEGLLPVERYLTATLEERDALTAGQKSIEQVANERSLNPRYLQMLWTALSVAAESSDSFVINRFRQKWQQATAADVPALVAEITAAQQALWKYNSIGQLTGDGVQKKWMEPVEKVTTRQDIRLALPPTDTDVVLYLTADDLGDGRDGDYVIWERPRIEFPTDESEAAHPPILLRDVYGLDERIKKALASEGPRTTAYLDGVDKLRASTATLEEFAEANGLNPQLLKAWSTLLGLERKEKREIRGLFTNKLTSLHNYDSINGWAAGNLPSLLTNRSKEDVTFRTLTIPARGVTVHPTPTQESIIAWRSPLDGQVRIEGFAADADDKCGNGFAWRVELHAETGTTQLASGTVDNGRRQTFSPEGETAIHAGDVVSLIINARDNTHVCDTTHVALKLTEVGGETRVWDLATDVVDRILESNPLPDAYGNLKTWHFGASEDVGSTKSLLPPGSALAQWRAAVLGEKPVDEIQQLAQSVQTAITTTDEASLSEPDRALRTLLNDWKGPLHWATVAGTAASGSDSTFGIDPAQFGKHPNGSAIEPASLCVQAPQILEVQLPKELASGAEFVVSGTLHPATATGGSVQLQVLSTKPVSLSSSPALPILVSADEKTQQRAKQAVAEFRNLFPAALCYAQIVPVDEVVTLSLYFREDDQLKRLMLNDEQVAELDRLWDELYYVAQEPIALTVAYEQIYEFATQDRPDLVKSFEPMRGPINARADLFRTRLKETEPAHVDAVLEFANRAWRRPLSESEQEDLRKLYDGLRQSDIPHEEAIQLTLARVLASPAFLYRLETPPAGDAAAEVSGMELANRLSYFLWSSLPDAELREAGDSGALLSEDVLQKQTRRMLADPRTRRLAVQFACQWLHLRDFDQNDDKNEALYPEFAELRGAMYEETVRFFEDMFRNDGSILDLLNADHAFVNAALAEHYGIDGVEGDEWRRVEGLQAQGRGGILGMATFLASQSGASRTSPILRGNWIYETLLGERLPRPPANIPQLPETVPAGLSARQLIEKHSSAPECATCHVRIDPFGFALEQYDAIGRLRPEPADTKTVLDNGQPMEGIAGLRNYLLTVRRDDVVRQFCRKLLGYALGREVQLSDEPLLATMQEKLKAGDYRFHVAVEAIVSSEQFQRIRGRDFVGD